MRGRPSLPRAIPLSAQLDGYFCVSSFANRFPSIFFGVLRNFISYRPSRLCLFYCLCFCSTSPFRVAFFGVDHVVCYYVLFLHHHPLSPFCQKRFRCFVPYQSSSHPFLPLLLDCTNKAFPVMATHIFVHTIFISVWHLTCCLSVFRTSHPTLLAPHSH